MKRKWVVILGNEVTVACNFHLGILQIDLTPFVEKLCYASLLEHQYSQNLTNSKQVFVHPFLYKIKLL